jgi:hypothetical protein
LPSEMKGNKMSILENMDEIQAKYADIIEKSKIAREAQNFWNVGGVQVVSVGSANDVLSENSLGRDSVSWYENMTRSKNAALARQFAAVGGVKTYPSGKENNQATKTKSMSVSDKTAELQPDEKFQKLSGEFNAKIWGFGSSKENS